MRYAATILCSVCVKALFPPYTVSAEAFRNPDAISLSHIIINIPLRLTFTSVQTKSWGLKEFEVQTPPRHHTYLEADHETVCVRLGDVEGYGVIVGMKAWKSIGLDYVL